MWSHPIPNDCRGKGRYVISPLTNRTKTGLRGFAIQYHSRWSVTVVYHTVDEAPSRSLSWDVRKPFSEASPFRSVMVVYTLNVTRWIAFQQFSGSSPRTLITVGASWEDAAGGTLRHGFGARQTGCSHAYHQPADDAPSGFASSLSCAPAHHRE